MNHFFAYLDRLKLIRRWGLMRNTVPENDMEHSMQTALIAHGLAVLGKTRHQRDIDPAHVVVLALYHDVGEVITGDLPTPVKYKTPGIQDAYAAVEADLRTLNARAEALRRRLEALVQADAEAFLPVAAAYKLPKETPEQQAHKAAVLEKALDRACAVPLEVMTACGEGIALAAEYAEKGSVLARSDAGCAALFCKAAMQAAGLNVKVNTRLMADKAHADALEARAEQLLAEFVPQADRVYQTVSNE